MKTFIMYVRVGVFQGLLLISSTGDISICTYIHGISKLSSIQTISCNLREIKIEKLNIKCVKKKIDFGNFIIYFRHR